LEQLGNSYARLLASDEAKTLLEDEKKLIILKHQDLSI